MYLRVQTLQATRAAYHAAADTYDHPVLSFRERLGREIARRLGLRSGAHVLDAGCGTGAVALPAALVVGPTGRVVGVDLAPGMIERAWAKARRAGLDQVEFHEGDFEALKEPDGAFDAVVCAFALGDAADRAAAVRRLWRWVRRGGRLAVATWGPRRFEPVDAVVRAGLREIGVEPGRVLGEGERLATAEALVSLLSRAGVSGASAEGWAGRHALGGPDDGWRLVLGSGYRGAVERLTPVERRGLEQAFRAAWPAAGADTIDVGVNFATAVRRDGA